MGVKTISLDEPWRKYRDAKSFASLNGLRGFCILEVIWHHIPKDFAIDRMLHGSFLGVTIFFNISGFLIVTLLLRERDRTGEISLTKFYARRILRIFPLYYLLVFGAFLAYLALKPEMVRFYSQAFPYLLTHTVNWPALDHRNSMRIMWSMATEEQFYLVWPALEKFLSNRSVLVVLVVVIGINQIVNFGLFDKQIHALYQGSETELPFIWEVTFTPLALGVLLAHILHDQHSFKWMYVVIGWRWSCAFCFALLSLILCISPSELSGVPRLSTQLVTACLLGCLVAREDHVAYSIMNVSPLRVIGIMSYGIFIWHMAMIAMWSRLIARFGFLGQGGPLVKFMLVVSTTIGMAAITFYAIEQPVQRLKARFRS